MEDNFGEQTLESMNQADWYNQWTMDKFKDFLKGNILEIGCGIGNFTKSLFKFGDIYAIDKDKDYVKKTKKLLNKTAVHVGIGDIEKGRYFFKNIKFDSIVCINVLEHIKDDAQAIKNMYEVLNKEGNLILLVPSHPFLYGEIDKSIGHFRRYSKSEIVSKLEKAGFKFISIRRINFLGAIGWFLAGKVFTQSVIDKHEIKIFNLVGPLVLPVENLIEPPFGTSILIIASKKI